VFTSLPSLSCGGIAEASAIAVEESGSAAGQVLLLGGCDEEGAALSTVHQVGLAPGACTPQPPLITSRNDFMAVRLPDGSTACTGGGFTRFGGGGVHRKVESRVRHGRGHSCPA